MSAASEQPHAAEPVTAAPPPAAEQPALLRLVEPGPPAELAEQPARWRSAALCGLPDLRPQAPAPLRVVARPAPAARLAITEAEARGLAGAVARAVLEALDGRRPLQQLAALLSDRALATVHTLRRGGLRWPVRRATVTGVRVFMPGRAAVEACVTFTCDGRTRVLALRLDREGRRWIGTAVRVG